MQKSLYLATYYQKDKQTGQLYWALLLVREESHFRAEAQAKALTPQDYTYHNTEHLDEQKLDKKGYLELFYS